MNRFLSALLITITLSMVYVALTHKAPVRSFRTQNADFKLITIAGSLSHPWSLGFLPGGNFLVTERSGRLLFINSKGEAMPIKGMPAVYAEEQGGLLDVLVPQDFKDGSYIYFTYAATDPDNPDLSGTQVAKARLYTSQLRIDDLQILFIQKPKIESGHHFGSRIVEGLDGFLYVSLGERGEMQQAQNPLSHQGKIVRLAKDGKPLSDNPYAHDPNFLKEIYSYGHRNPQGLCLHPDTGELWETEHGPQGGDEINIIIPGANYGWPKTTYGKNYVIGTNISEYTELPGITKPLWQWTPSIAPSGMAFYTGTIFPNWKGNLFVGALAHRHLERLEIKDHKITQREILIQAFGKRIRDVRNGPDGYLYLLTDEDKGELIRIEPETAQ